MIRVGLVYGGTSPEYSVSLRSAQTIIQHLDQKQFVIIPIHIDPQGNWYIDSVFGLSHSDFENTKSIITSQKIPTHLPCDVIFSVIHGAVGEDGSIQGLFEVLGIPYIGSSVLGSAIGMDKEISKKILSLENWIKVVPFVRLNDYEIKQGINYIQDRIFSSLQYPIFIKPGSAGSSIGINKVSNHNQLMPALYEAAKYDRFILIEQGLEVREIEVAVLENATYGMEPLVSLPGEVIVQHNFYSYDAKYHNSHAASLQIPANLSKMQVDFLKTAAKRIFTILKLEGMARIDFFLEKQRGEIYFNEINTIPGFTESSMYPKLWETSGKSLTQLLTHLIQLAFARQKRKYQADKV